MEKWQGYEETQAFSDTKTLEVGGKILKIIGAKVEPFDNFSILKIAFDIAEGEEKDYYNQRFESNKKSNPDAKWGGVFDVFIPKNDGSEKDGWTKQAFKTFTTSLEESNSGYKWDWNESKLKGKLFGGIFGREEYESNSEFKWATKIRFARSIETIKSGKFELPKDKPHKNHVQTSTNFGSIPSSFEEILSDDGVPF